MEAQASKSSIENRLYGFEGRIVEAGDCQRYEGGYPIVTANTLYGLAIH